MATVPGVRAGRVMQVLPEKFLVAQASRLCIRE